MKKHYKSNEDKRLIEKSYNNILQIIFGEKQPKRKKGFTDFFEDNVKEVNVYPRGTTTSYINDHVPGICRLDTTDNKLIIDMLGYTNSNRYDRSQQEWIKHEGTHEFCHSFADLLPQYFSNHKDGIIKEGTLRQGNKIKIFRQNHMGMIKETDLSGNPVGQRYYGKMFNETMMDIVTSMAINAFDSPGNIRTPNDILEKPINQWGNAETSYGIFTSITRLAIAAFSNTSFSDYQSVINSGYGIFDTNVTMKNGEKYKTNDFLYGILFDPLHLEEQFDKFAGNDEYRRFCEPLDRMFLQNLEKRKVPSEHVKYIMNVLADIINKRMKYYLEKGIIEASESNKIISNFNNIWNSMQTEYKAFFSSDDINQIRKRAGK